MATKRGLLLLTALATLSVPTASAHAATGQINCPGDASTVASDGTARFSCIVEGLRRREVAYLPAPPGCGRYREFDAGASADDILAYDYRRMPARRFQLRDEDGRDTATDEKAPMRVIAYVNRKRLKFVNNSRFKVDVSYTMRCPL